MAKKLKVMTVVGTRPEIIRLSETIKLLDQHTDHVLVHTGQNWDYELNEVFFEDLGLRSPDHFLNADVSSLGAAMGSILAGTERVIAEERPDAFLVLGDTNSCISAVIAKRMKVPVFHMEAGNRCFDERVPEETNRRLVDHVADYNLVYTEHARRNLLSEGIHPSRILLTGSPMREVLDANKPGIDASDVLTREGVEPSGYFLVSVHREENVDSADRLEDIVATLTAVATEYALPVIVSTHPRTMKRLEGLPGGVPAGIRFQKPYGFHDYNKLQMNAKAVLSDSGTISEESVILGFPAVTLRDFIERPEAQDAGRIITAGVRPDSVMMALNYVLSQDRLTEGPQEYDVANTAQRTLSFVLSSTHSHAWRP